MEEPRKDPQRQPGFMSWPRQWITEAWSGLQPTGLTAEWGDATALSLGCLPQSRAQLHQSTPANKLLRPPTMHTPLDRADAAGRQCPAGARWDCHWQSSCKGQAAVSMGRGKCPRELRVEGRAYAGPDRVWGRLYRSPLSTVTSTGYRYTVGSGQSKNILSFHPEAGWQAQGPF